MSHGLMAPTLGFFREDAVADPPRRVPRDWWLLGAIIAVALVEGVFNTPLIWRPWLIALTILLAPTVLWRRTHPLASLSVVMIGMNGMLAVPSVISEIPEGPYTAAFLLINVYALFRWGSGRDSAIGLAIMAAVFVLNLVVDYGGIGETIGGALVLLFPAELGVLVRFQHRSRQQMLDEVRATEREQIARELHDTVAHHVSAIAIQAQAGRAVAASNPAAAENALGVIEEEAARTLSDMRSMVGSLRGDDHADLVPQPGLSEIAALAGEVGGLEVSVETPARSDASAAVGAALYRIAQESVTNAVRHARGASLVNVRVERSGDAYQLRVSDNGRAGGPDSAAASGPPGYGLVGMAERARLLGGTLRAGPSPQGGWTVEAELPARLQQGAV